MASESEPNELYDLQTENRHLKEMVGALRDEKDCGRIYMTVQADYRKGAMNRIEGKIKSIEAKL